MNGVTTLGRSVFADMEHVETVSLAPSVTVIDNSAFYNCSLLTSITLPDGVATIGPGAFVGTGLTSITVPNSSCAINSYALGYFEGRNHQLFPKTGFTIYGYAGSTAQSYAAQHNFAFIDLGAAQHDIYVEQGSAYNAVTNERVTKARAGERIYCVPDRMQSYKIFTDFYTYDNNITLDETDWSFTMPDEEVNIYMHCDNAWPLSIDMSNGSCAIGQQDYEYLAGCINDGVLRAELKSGATDEYYITLPDDSDILLTPTGVFMFDYDYAPSYCLKLPNGYTRNPININFAPNQISGGTLDLTVPAAGSPWDFNTMQADLVPGSEDWNAGRFTVSEAVWYNAWGISAFDTFEGGSRYFVGFTLVPNDGYYFTVNSQMQIRVAGYDRDIYLKPFYMNTDGSVYYSAGETWEQIMIVGGEPHSISFANARASFPDASQTPITQAVPGQEIYLRIDPDSLDDDEYLVMGSVNVTSNDVEVSSLELVDVWHFFMPQHNVTGTLTFETEAQINTSVLPLYSGEVNVPFDGSQGCENFGVACIMGMKCADSYYDLDEGKVYYDIDGDGSWDILRRDNNKYSLLSSSSLTENVTVTTTREESYRYPVRNVRLQVAAETAHTITIIGGVASSAHDDFANRHVITQAYPGETVYVFPRSSDIDDDSYIVQFSMSATSSDVTIYDDAGVSFVMPNKDVTVRLDYDCYTQDISIFDFRFDNTFTITPTEPGVRSEAYGASMVLRLTAANQQNVSGDIYRYDIDGDGSWDIEQDRSTDTYTLLSTHSLPQTDVNLTLTREQSWTLPIRTVLICTHNNAYTPLRGDVDKDGVVTINDATMLQRYLAEFTNPDGTPLIDPDDPISFSCADANNDGYISIKDVTAIQRYLAGLEDLMP